MFHTYTWIIYYNVFNNLCYKPLIILYEGQNVSTDNIKFYLVKPIGINT